MPPYVMLPENPSGALCLLGPSMIWEGLALLTSQSQLFVALGVRASDFSGDCQWV